MPFTGGYNPSPERTGGGDGSTNAPLLQRVFESIAAARGKAYDQTLNSLVGAENMAYARAVTFDLFGANVRFANEMNPAYSTASGLLSRWESILAQPPMPGDPESVRRARCAAALARFVRTNNSQPVIDVLTATLGKLFTGLTLFTPSNAQQWWPAYGGSSVAADHALYGPCEITGNAGTIYTVALLSAVPTSAAGARLVLSNCAQPANNGSWLVHDYVSSTSVRVAIPTGGFGADYGVGGTIGSPTIKWSMPNPPAPFTSTVGHVDVLVTPTAAPGYTNADGSLNGKFYALVNQINPILDLMLPADVTFDWYVFSSHGAIGFYLDDPNNLDGEAFDT